MITLHLTMNGIYYNNIFVVISAIFLSCFSKHQITEMTVVTTLASLTFPIFIIHPCLYGIWINSILKNGYQEIFSVFWDIFSANILMYAVSAGIALIGRAIASLQ